MVVHLDDNKQLQKLCDYAAPTTLIRFVKVSVFVSTKTKQNIFDYTQSQLIRCVSRGGPPYFGTSSPPTSLVHGLDPPLMTFWFRFHLTTLTWLRMKTHTF